MAKGDHIYVTRTLGYTHHGIDCGDGTVIHFTGEPGKKMSKSEAGIARSMLSDFALDSIVHVREYSKKDDAQVVIDRAESKIGSKDYHLVTNNCEHFATWCCVASELTTVAVDPDGPQLRYGLSLDVSEVTPLIQRA